VHATQEKIAIVLPNHLGDVAMATPVLRALRSGRPKARIRAVVRPELAPLLGGLRSIDEIVPSESLGVRGWFRRALGRLRLARSLGATDTVVVLPNSFSSALFAWATGAPRRVGYARRGRGLLLSQRVPAPRRHGRFQPVAMERYYLELARALGCPDLGTSLELVLEPDAERRCDARFAEARIERGRPLVCIAPGAAYGAAKLWPTRHFAELARGLAADGAQLALIHAPSEQPLADAIRAQAPGVAIAELGGAGMDLALLKAVIARASLVVCNDAGARHVAAAFAVPCLVLMGPTSIEYTNLNLERTRLLREPVPCAPCQRRVCPIDHRCLTRLAPARVLEEARAALRSGWQGDVALELRA
jgi:heptosyltransferase-2